MDESDSIESSNVTNDDSNGCNESDNKLTQYMLINKELSKTLAVLRAENAKLRNNNKELNLENLTYRNELNSNRAEISKWRKKFTKLQAMHIQHVEVLTTELQSYADKLSGVFGGSDDENGETEITSRLTDQHSTIVNCPSNDDDRENVPQRVNRSEPSIKPSVMLDENPSNLNTINEESEEDIQTSCSEQISLVTSTHESNVSEETSDTICRVDASRTIVARNSVSDSCEMASMNSDKENERPSSFLATRLNITNENSSLTDNENSSATIRSHANESIKRSTTPLKEKFITQRRTKKRIADDSFEDSKNSELVSSTPYKRKRSLTESEVDTRNNTPVKPNDSVRMTRRSTMSISSSGRPKRTVCPVSLAEPKLNTKMRRPRA